MNYFWGKLRFNFMHKQLRYSLCKSFEHIAVQIKIPHTAMNCRARCFKTVQHTQRAVYGTGMGKRTLNVYRIGEKYALLSSAKVQASAFAQKVEHIAFRKNTVNVTIHINKYSKSVVKSIDEHILGYLNLLYIAIRPQKKISNAYENWQKCLPILCSPPTLTTWYQALKPDFAETFWIFPLLLSNQHFTAVGLWIKMIYNFYVMQR